MQQTLLVAINAKYTHTNLAVRVLQNALTASGVACAFAEYTINQPVRDILEDIARLAPDRLLFSCYIWNISHVRALGELYRLLFPHAEILLGGPEVSFEAEKQLAQMPWADAVFCGEGELILPQTLLGGRAQGVYRAKEAVDLDTLPFPYRDLDALSNRVLYYEASRGCPFGCAYCLSSADPEVRVRSLEKVYDDLQQLLDAKVMKVKFVDRTFNLNRHRSTAIWDYLIRHDNGVTSFQMELGGDLTTPEQLQLLQTARAGLFQFEIGVQSTCAETLRIAARSTDLNRLTKNVIAVRQAGNIHQHLDLIAGLPGEDFAAFAKSYDEVFALRPEQIQLGFLKLLRGSRLYEQREQWGLLFSPAPPYEILQTPFLTFAELSRLKMVERATEWYYNSGRFASMLEEWLRRRKSPFAAMLLLGQSLEGVSQYDAYDLLYARALQDGCDGERMAWLMRLDLCLNARPRKLPRFCAPGASAAERKHRIGRERQGERYWDLFPASVLGGNETRSVVVEFDYARRDFRGRAHMTVLDPSCPPGAQACTDC